VRLAEGGEDLQGISQLFEAFIDQFDIAAVGVVAEKFECVGDDFADQIALWDVTQRFNELRCRMMHLCQVIPADDRGGLGRFLRLLDIVVDPV